MKRIIFCIVTFVAGLSAFGKPAEQTVQFTDLTTDTIKADSLLDIQNHGCMFGRNPFHDDSKPHFTLFVGGLFGGGGPSMGDHGASYEFGVLNLVGVAYYTSHHNQRLSAGLGVMIKGVNCGNDSFLLRHDDNSVTVEHVANGYAENFTKFEISSFIIPLFYRQRLYKPLNFYAGPIVRCNMRCSPKTKNEESKEDKWRVSNLRRFNIDLMAGIDCFWLGFYIKYSPLSDIKNCSQFNNTLTLGGTIAF